MVLGLKSTRGLWVISYASGEKSGIVQDAHLESAGKKLSALRIRTGNLFSGQDRWLPVADIKKIGKDVVIISKQDVLVKERPAGKSLSELEGMKVTSKDGKTLGSLSDVQVDVPSYEMKALCLASNQKVEVLTDELVLGEDLIIVQAKPKLEAFRSKMPDEADLISDVAALVSKHTEDAVKQGGEVAKRATAAVKQVLVGLSTAETGQPAEKRPKTSKKGTKTGAAKPGSLKRPT